MRFVKSLCLIILLLFSTIVCALSVINNVRVNQLPNQWQFVLDASSPIEFRSFSLDKPARLVVDLKNVQWRTSLQAKLWRNTGVSSIRLGKNDQGKQRMVFDLNSDYSFNVQRLARSVSRPDRLVINIAKYRHQSTQFKRDEAIDSLKQEIENSMVAEVKSLMHDKPAAKRKPDIPRAVAKAAPIKSTPKSQVIDKPINPMRKVIVVIDPGHGGKDPGATGRRGTHEKHVVLNISRRLQQLINQQPGFKAVLTRDGDYYLSLRKRLAIARKYKADMFIAIHADAFKNRNAHGASVYALSERGATSEAARWLAQRENQSELMGGVDLSDKGHLLRSVLLDLSQTATTSASLKIGLRMLHSLKHVTNLHHSKVEQAAFVVLKSPDIPSLLVETGFISNWREEKNLRSDFYQNKIANALMSGIKHYFYQYPPRDSWLAYQQRHRQRYVVNRGDTLSEIADRFSVSVNEIKNSNQLTNQRLRVGQVLMIPTRSV